MYKAKLGEKEFSISFEEDNLNKVQLNGKDRSLDLLSLSSDSFHLIEQNKGYNVELVSINYQEKKVKLKVNGTVYEYEVLDKLDLLLKEMGLSSLATVKLTELKAPMPGLVLDVLVEPGAKVNKGDGLVVLEAMKMENVIKSPTDAEVKSIEVSKGDAVEKNQVLIQFS